MMKRNFPKTVMDWTQSMLESRTLTATHNEAQVDGRPVGGCPQGGVLSPLMWSLVVDNLLEKLREQGFLVYGYADDVAIVARGKFLDVLRDRINYSMQTLEEWCGEAKLSINPEKTAAMIFTRKYKVVPPEPLVFQGADIDYTNSVKYLGVLLDPELHWSAHVTSQIGKTYASMWACRRAMGRDWGFSPKISLWLYKMVLLPRLMYAAVVWWPRARKVECMIRLKALQGNFLRAATAAMRTTPTDALEVALDMPPLDLLAVYRAEATAYRLKCQGKWTQSRAAHARLDILGKKPLNMTQDRTTRKYQIRKVFKTYIPKRENWVTINKTPGAKVMHWYTDGSGYRDHFGAGLYGPGENYKGSWSLGTMATVFQAETLAIKRCVELLLNRLTKDKYIYIWSDSQAAIRALLRPTADSVLVWDTMRALEDLGKGNKVTLAWVPGHEGIPGNEMADKLAKEGTTLETDNSPVGIPFATGMSQIKRKLNREHSKRWGNTKVCRTAKAIMPELNSKRTRQLTNMTRRELSLTIRLLTGHGKFKSHCKTIGIGEDDRCRFCNEEKEDSIHILCKCPALAIQRLRHWGTAFPTSNQLAEREVVDILRLAIKADLDI